MSGLPFQEESIRRILARKEAFIRGLLAEVGPRPTVEVELTGEGLLTYKQVKRAMEGRFGLPLDGLPAAVAEFAREVGRELEVEPESQWLFVEGHEHAGLPEGAYCLISDGVKAPFTWWLDTAVLDGEVRLPDGWRIRATESPCVMGIYPA